MVHSSAPNLLPGGIRLRPMHESDLPAVYSLEALSQVIPWPRWFFRQQLRRGAACRVLEQDGQIIGFGIVSFAKQRAHIMNMCVAPGYRRRGLGRRLLLHLLGIARQHHCKRVWLEVRRNNRPAILLYRKLGFRKKLVCKGYYQNRGGKENGLVMARPLRLSKSMKQQK